MRANLIITSCALLLLQISVTRGASEFPLLLASASEAGVKPDAKGQDQNNGGEKEKSPEQKMQARFPQPVQVSYLLGLPVLDGRDSTIGYVKDVVRTPEGKIQLIVPYGKWFGWLRYGDWARRPVPVPIETVSILATQINALEMERSDFDRAPDWIPAQTRPIAPDQTIQIAISRR